MLTFIYIKLKEEKKKKSTFSFHSVEDVICSGPHEVQFWNYPNTDSWSPYDSCVTHGSVSCSQTVKWLYRQQMKKSPASERNVFLSRFDDDRCLVFLHRLMKELCCVYTLSTNFTAKMKWGSSKKQTRYCNRTCKWRFIHLSEPRRKTWNQ